MRRSVVTRHCLSKKLDAEMGRVPRAGCATRCRPYGARWCVDASVGTGDSTATHQRRAPGGLVLTRYEGGGKWGPRHIPW
jgi:hypothetical protein